MININNKIELNVKDVQHKPFFQKDFWQQNSYSPLLNQQELIKGLKRNIWKYELKPMLNGFISNIKEFKQELRFRVSGKILNSSTYVLKTKSNKVINNSLQTQEDIKDAQLIEIEDEHPENEVYEGEEEDTFEDYDDEAELFEVFAELAAENQLTKEQIASFKEEKLNRILNLELSELNDKIKDKINNLRIYPKPIFKRIDLRDVAATLNNVLKARTIEIEQRTPKIKKIDKSKLPFLPENLIANAEKKRMNFENRIEDFYKVLKQIYSNEPVAFLDLIKEPTAKALVDALLIALHLINQKRIELWVKYSQRDEKLIEKYSENDGQGIYISPF